MIFQDDMKVCSDKINYTCGICNNTFNRADKYPDFTVPPYVSLMFAGQSVAKPLCPYCFNEWKDRLKINDRDFMGGEK